MPKRIRKIKTFYIDANVVLDYITGRNTRTISVLEKIKSKGWKCISSSFLTMEVADYKKDSLFVIDKVIDKRWEMRRIIRETYKKDLRASDFEKVLDWFSDFLLEYKLELFDFLVTTDNWFLPQRIAFNSNLNAPDAVHLASAMIGAFNEQCQVLITNDKFFATEAKNAMENKRVVDKKPKLEIMTIADVEKKYFPKKR